MKQAEALELVALLEAAYRQELPESSKLLYADFLTGHERRLGDYDAAVVIREVIRSNRFFPSIAELEDELSDRYNEARRRMEWDEAEKRMAAREALPEPPPVPPTDEQLERLRQGAKRYGPGSMSAWALKRAEQARESG